METVNFEKGNYLETGRPAEVGELSAGEVVGNRVEDGGLRFWSANGCGLEIVVVAEKVVRFRYVPSGEFSDGFSYALVEEALDGRRVPECEEGEESYLVKAGRLVVEVSKVGMHLRIRDEEGRLLSEDEKGFHWYENETYGGETVMMSRVLQGGEHFYGLGDVPGRKNLRGQRRQLWGSDVYGYDEATDPLYKNIPFFVGRHHGISYGIFLDNSFRTTFDFGKERPSVSSFWAQGGELNFYFILGPTVPEVVSGYVGLTGTPELPPLWSLGFHQCKWSYQSEAEVLAVAREFREREIPCDAIYVDIDYMDGFRCFTWNRAEGRYPNPKRMTDELLRQGIRTVAIIDPGIKIDPNYEVYRSGKEAGVFCRRMDGPLLKGNVWPGPCHFPEFTDPRVREWWADLFPAFLNESGVAGIWTDMNEPAVFNEEKTFPRDVRHDYDGHPCSHRKAHNVYGMQMARATQEGVRRALPGRRPFVITRSAYAGTQRYSSAWTGDIQSSWDHLRIGNVQCQRLAMSGYSFVGTDIGGFSGRSNGELFVRWLQLGVFHPFCRVHSSGDENEQEPWSFGEPYTTIAKKFIELRYRILPYLYTVFEDHVRTGAPMLRSLVYLDENDPQNHYRMEEFALGGDLFTCPVSKAGAEGRWFYLPQGLWYDFWTNEEVMGGEERWMEVPLETTPLFARAGRILPFSPVVMHSGAKKEWMELVGYLENGEGKGTLYEDAGDGDAGGVRKTFELVGGVLRQTREGKYRPDYEKYRITIHGAIWTKAVVDGGEPQMLKFGEALEVPESFERIEFS